MSGRSNNRPTPPATPPVDEAQREQAMKFMQMLAGKGQEYVPILKSLRQIGIEPKIMPVMIGDEPTDCLVIPQHELMLKEWSRMSGQEQENS
jgi:hypothetical protein